jgi:hypothetical protein
VEEWCFGYMKGKSLDDWSGLPGELRPSLEVIALHGVEKNFPVLEKMTGEQFEKYFPYSACCTGTLSVLVVSENVRGIIPACSSEGGRKHARAK